MAKFKWDCPRPACRTRSASFSTSSAFYSAEDGTTTAVGHCAVCGRVTLFELVAMPPFRDATQVVQTGYDIFSLSFRDTLKANGFESIEVLRTIPEPPEIKVPDHVPESVASSYLDGLKALDAGLWEAGAFSIRKALERGVRSFIPDGDEGLKARIKRLSGSQQVPPAMIELAHTVRAEGNVAVHEEAWTAAESRQLADFAYLFFTYIFTLPAQVKLVALERGAAAERR